MRTTKDILTEDIQRSISNYSRMGIEVNILEVDEDSLVASVTQKRLYNGFVLSQKELVERGKEIFQTIVGKVIIRPLTYTLDIRDITPEWIKSRMEEFGIKRNDVLTHLHIDKSTLSLYLSGQRSLSRMVKAAFFWYFLTFEINRDLREGL